MANKSTARDVEWYLSIPVMISRKIRYYLHLPNFLPNIRLYEWDTNAEFSSVYEKFTNFALMERGSAFNIWQLCKQAVMIPGEVAELGVYQGGTAGLIAEVTAPHRKYVHLFDTFEGIPDVNEREDIHKEGDFNDTSLNSVKSLLSDYGYIIFHPGYFPDTTLDLNDTKFAFAHIDADIYQSTKDACEFFYPRMSRGGIMIFHDYDISSCPGVRKAVDEYFLSKPERVLYLPTNQCYIMKI